MNDYTANQASTIADMINIGSGCNLNEDMSNVFTDFQVNKRDIIID